MAYLAEYTDTFGGEPNYCWVRRAVVPASAVTAPYASPLYRRQKLSAARAALGLSGVRGDILMDSGDEIHWKPRGCCTILMVRWDDSAEEEAEAED